MSEINQVGRSVIQQPTLQDERLRTELNAPGELQKARPSVGVIIARVIGGIFSLGISEGIIALVQYVRSGSAPTPRVTGTGVPSLRPIDDVFNNNLANEVRNGTITSILHEEAVQSALSDLRDIFGQNIVPENTTLQNIPNNSTLRDMVSRAVCSSTEPVSGPVLHNIIMEKAKPLLFQQILVPHIEELIRQIGDVGVPPSTIASSFMKNNPELSEAISACTDRDSIEETLNRFMPAFREDIELRHACEKAQNKAIDNAIQKFAGETGLDREFVQQKLNFLSLKNSITYLKSDIFTGKQTVRGEEIDTLFQNKADSFVNEKVQLYSSVDELNISSRLKEEWKNRALTEDTLNKGNLFSLYYSVGTSVNASWLLEILNNPELEAEDLFGFMVGLATQFDNALKSNGWSQLDADKRANLEVYSAQAMFDVVPGLKERLESRPDLIQRLHDLGYNYQRSGSTMLNDANKLDDETEMTIKSEQASVKLRAGKVVLVMMNDFSDSALAE